MARTLKSDAVIQLDFKPLGLGISEPLKQSGSSRSQMIFKVCSLRSFHRKHMCWNLLLEGLKTCIFNKKRPQHRYFPVQIFMTRFFYRAPPVALLAVLRQYRKVSWGVCSLILPFHVLYLNAKLLYK